MARLYTKTGDGGETYCFALGSRVPKDHPIIEFMGVLDEANSVLGLAGAYCSGEARGIVGELQRLLFRVGFSLGGNARIGEDDVEWLESIADKYMAGIELKGFVVPGGGMCSSHLHVARTIVRRAERRLVSAYRAGVEVKAGIDGILMAIKVLNRMSDSLYALAVWFQEKEAGLTYL